MRKLLLTFVALFATGALMFGQDEILINDFTGTLDPNQIYGDDYDANGAPNRSVVTFEDNMLKAEYVWNAPDWFPRAVWYVFDDYMDLSDHPVLEVKFMAEDMDNDSLHVRLDLYGDGAEPLNDTIREMMETNGNPWEIWATNGEWYTLGSNFTEENRWYCTYYGGAIDPVRVDSTRINGFEAFVNYGDAKYQNQPGTLWIDYIKATDVATGVERYLVGGENAFGLAVYPTPAVDQVRFNAERTIQRIDIFDMTGKRVFTRNNIQQQRFELNVSEFSTGIYITNVYDEKGTMVSEKIVKK